MKNIKYTALVLLLVFALIGGAYAAWSEELVITGSVETADFEVEFGNFRVYQDYDGQAALADWVGTGDLSYGDTEAVLDGNEITITLTNVYPGHSSFIMMEILSHNSSIPMEVRLVGDTDQSYPGEVYINLRDHTGIDWLTGDWVTIEPGGNNLMYFDSEVLGDANRGDTDSYSFNWELQFRQGVGSQASFE